MNRTSFMCSYFFFSSRMLHSLPDWLFCVNNDEDRGVISGNKVFLLFSTSLSHDERLRCKKIVEMWMNEDAFFYVKHCAKYCSIISGPPSTFLGGFLPHLLIKPFQQNNNRKEVKKSCLFSCCYTFAWSPTFWWKSFVTSLIAFVMPAYFWLISFETPHIPSVTLANLSCISLFNVPIVSDKRSILTVWDVMFFFQSCQSLVHIFDVFFNRRKLFKMWVS